MNNNNSDQDDVQPAESKWARMVEGVRSYVDDQDRAWGGVDANLLARFELGSCTEEERARVEQVMRDYPAVREAVEIARELETEWDAASEKAVPAPLQPVGPQLPPVNPLDPTPVISTSTSVVQGEYSTPIPSMSETNEPADVRRPRNPWSIREWSLIEWSAVAAIILFAVMLSVPALNERREAQRRAQCINNLRQLGLALHNYNSSEGSYPPGRIWNGSRWKSSFGGDQNTTWLGALLPYLEQGSLANAYNYTLGAEGPILGATNIPALDANSTVTATRLNLLQCPSDHPRDSYIINPNYIGPKYGSAAFTFSKSNYAASWGNTGWGQGIAGTYKSEYRQSAFGHKMDITTASMSDGASNTVFFAEVLRGATYDIRGTPWLSIPGGAGFMNRFTPNAYRDYLNQQSGGDYISNNPTLFCTPEPIMGLNCFPNASDSDAFAGARSHHPGGINAVLGDGSVRFIKNSINEKVWRGLNTISGGEPIPSDEF